MLLTYKTFYFRYGVRRPDQMLKPPLPFIARLNVPRNSIFHYLGVSQIDPGPSASENILKLVTKPMFIETVKDINGTHAGKPIPIHMDVEKIARIHRMQNPRFRPSRGIEASTRDPETVLVYNYAYLHRLFRYPRNYYALYNRWYNVIDRAVAKMAEVASQITDHHQFIQFDLPNVLPPISALRIAEKGLNQQIALMFSRPETIIQLELWRWFGPKRQESMFSKIPLDRLNQINIVFTDRSARWVVINLGQLEQWRKATKEELLANPELNTKGYDAETMQKRMLRLAMAAMDARSGDVPESLGDEKKAEETQAVDPTQLGTPAPEVETGAEIDVSSGIDGIDIDDEPKYDQTQGYDEPAVQQTPGEVEAQQIDSDLDALELITPEVEDPQDEGGEVELVAVQERNYETSIIEHANRLADQGGLTAAEYKKYLEQAAAYKNITAPDGTKLGDFIEIGQDALKIQQSNDIPDSATIVDKSMLKSSLLEMDSRYISDIMQKDIASMVVAMQNAGILVTGYDVEEVETVDGAYYDYTIKIKPLQGQPSTLKFKMPKVQANGEFRTNGVTYRTRKQRSDMPIRKIAPNRVALTSYYGKLFVERSEKKVNDYGRWLRDSIMAIGLRREDNLVSNLVTGNAFNNDAVVPRTYSQVAMGFRSFTVRVNADGVDSFWALNFDYSARSKLYGDVVLDRLEEDGRVVVGMNDSSSYMVMATNGALYRTGGPTNDELLPLPGLEDILGIRSFKAPVEYAELRVFGRMIPVGVVLGYLFGLENLVKKLGVTPRRVPAGQRTNIAPDEWVMVFQDESWIFSRDDAVATLVLAGWRDYYKSTAHYPVHEFNRRDAYFNVLEDQKLGVRYLRELDLLDQMFIDPITKGLLEQMKEPTVFISLLLRASELLATDQHPHELDARFLRVKGYERFSGILYSELVKAIRIHNSKAGKANAAVEMNFYAVWIAISEDPAKDQVVQMNPIKGLKEQEAVTYSGTGGRSGRSMVKRTRAMHKTDLGTISEATSDSGDVGINTFLSANPKFDSLRGTATQFEIGVDGAASALSTSSLLAPAADRDDMKRMNFINIQNAHGVACDGYHQPMVRTGYESVIAHRTDDLYAYTAKEPGTITSLTPEGIIVTYDSGKTVGVQLGKRYGAAAGLVIPHQIATPLSLGDKVNVGDCIAFNTGFFEIDVLNPKQVVMKFSMTVKTVLMEAPDTLEDSSTISKKLAAKLTTEVTKVRSVIVSFDQVIHRAVRVGDQLDYESILCMIEDSVSANSDLLDKQSIDTLRVLSAASPSAKAKGVVERIEVFYNGEKEDMSPSLREMADLSDKTLAKRNRSIGKKPFTGSVDEGFRIDNDPLVLDTAVIQFYITSKVPAGVGDKGVFGNQLKTVFGRVIESEIRTEDGTEIDAIFGALSIDDRIVTSPYVIGTSNTLLKVIAKKAIEAYKS